MLAEQSIDARKGTIPQDVFPLDIRERAMERIADAHDCPSATRR
jgi:hypothetical protein